MNVGCTKIKRWILDFRVVIYRLIFFKWEDTIRSITQVYLQQIRIKNANNYKKQAKQLHAYYYQ